MKFGVSYAATSENCADHGGMHYSGVTSAAVMPPSTKTSVPVMNERIRGEEKRRPSDLLRQTEPAHWNVDKPPPLLLGVQELHQQFRPQRSRAQGVHPDGIRAGAQRGVRIEA